MYANAFLRIWSLTNGRAKTFDIYACSIVIYTCFKDEEEEAEYIIVIVLFSFTCTCVSRVCVLDSFPHGAMGS